MGARLAERRRRKRHLVTPGFAPTSAAGIPSMLRLAVAAIVAVVAGETRAGEGLAEPVVLFRQATDGVHTFRIPAVAVTAKGTALVACEARMLTAADRGEIEIHLRRSTDGGRTWEPARQVAHLGERLPRNPHLPASKRGRHFGEPDEQTVNNAVLIATRAGPVHLLYCVEYMRAFHCVSADDGLSWSAPREITPAIDAFRPRIDWQATAFGPGHGIETSTGRLVVPIWIADYRFGVPRSRSSAAAVLTSADAGATWQAGGIAVPAASEANVAELTDGRLLLSARNGDSRNQRIAAASADGGATWTAPFFLPDLPEYGCMAGLVRHPGTARHPGPLLLYSAPDTDDRAHKARRDLTVWLSRDDGRTWPVRRLLRAGPSAYSDLAVLPDGGILCVFESGLPGVGQQDGSKRPWAYACIAAVRFDLDWLCGTKPVAGPDPARVDAIAPLMTPRAAPVGPPITDRAAWGRLAACPAARRTIAEAAELAAEEWPELTEDLILEYSRTGQRMACEHVLAERRRRLVTWVLAECCENEGRFLTPIERALRSFCAERMWVAPAHDPRLATYEGTERSVDLHASITAWNLALTSAWLGDRLSPDVRELVRENLERRVFEPFERTADWGTFPLRWTKATGNWNAVCHAGVVGAVLAAVDDPRRRAWFVASAERNLEAFLGGFGGDGSCSEGIAYFNFGFGHYCLLAEAVAVSSAGRIDWLGRPDVARIARFAARLEMLPGLYPNFADCPADIRPDDQLQAFLSRRLGFGWRAAERRALDAAGGVESTALASTAVFALPALAAPPSATGADVPPPPRDWFDQAGVLVARPHDPATGMAVALKGGHNSEHHNHNDVGSFIVALGGGMPLVDPGPEIYTARTFSDRRYESPVLNSFGHPVPFVAGRLQRTGRKARGTPLRTEFTPDRDTVVLDLRTCYDVEGLERLEREFVYSRTGRGDLAVTDTVAFREPQAFGTALVTFDPAPRIEGPRITVGPEGGCVVVDVEAEGATPVITTTALEADLPHGRRAIRIGIDLDAPIAAGRISVRIRPAGPAAGD